MKKYLKKKEIFSYGIGLFGIALLTGWMPDYAYTYFVDFAFKGTGISSDAIKDILVTVFLVAGIVGAVAELVIGTLVDRTRSKLGKIRPWLLYGCLPLAFISMLVFLAPKITNQTMAFVWLFAAYCLYVCASVAVESPSNCFGAVITPNPDERSDAISIAGIFRSIGQSGGLVILPVVGLILTSVFGKDKFKALEGRGVDLQISTAVCIVGMLLFLLIMVFNTKERIPYSTEKPKLQESIKVVFTNKNLLMVALTKLAGFGRGVYSTVSLYIAIFLLGNKGLKLALLLPMGIGTAVSMLIVKSLLKKLSTKNVFIYCSLYGACAYALLFVVSKAIGFNQNLVIPFLIINFFVGLQHGNTNLTPNIMIADCVDEIEWKTGKRQEGLCYAGFGLFAKIAAALTKSFGPALMIWSGYVTSTKENVAYVSQSTTTLNRFLMIYTIIPAAFVILQFIPILFYDLTGKKKDKITMDLMQRRGMAEDGYADAGSNLPELKTEDKNLCESKEQNVLKKKVLFVMPSLNSGGAEKSLVTLLNLLDYDKLDVDLLLFRKEGLFLNDLPKQINVIDGGERYRLFDGSTKTLVLKSLKKMDLKLIKARLSYAKALTSNNRAKVWENLKYAMPKINKHYDAAVGYLEGNTIYYCVDCVDADTKIGYIHSDYTKLGLDAEFDRGFVNKLNYFISVSNECGNVLKKVFPEAVDKIRTIENITSAAMIKKLSDGEAEEYKNLNCKILLTVGRLRKEKGYNLAVEAAEKLVSDGFDFKWFAIGSGELKEEIEQLIKEKNLENNFILLGERSNPYPYIAGCDIYIQPSFYEGKSVAINEAKCLAKPIVSTKFTMVLDQLIDEKTAVLAEINSESIASKTEELLLSDEKRIMLTENLKNEKVGNEEEVQKFYKLIGI